MPICVTGSAGFCSRLLARSRTATPDLGLEFERRVPDGLIEEEQSRTDRGTSDASFRIKQRLLHINIEICDAREHSRRLPSVEAMPGRHEAELAIELAQSRFWQALDKRLAIMAFCALVSDQQMPSRLEAVFECFAPGNLYRVRLYCAPVR